MLSLLKIKNVALIDDLTIEFGDRLNIISGETGSGKSILLDSLGLCFGERADKTLIRTGESKMRATALFTNISSKAREYVTDTLGIECDDQIILDRECDQNGKSVARINGELTTVAGLKAVSNFLVDLHGQHEHQAIISPDYQLNIIDEYAGQTAKDLLAKINNHIDAVMDAKSQIDALGGDDAQREYFINLYRYQIDEIAGANIQPNELEDLVARRNKMNSVEKIGNALTQAQGLLSGADFDNACQSVKSAERELMSIAQYDTRYVDYQTRLNQAYLELKDLADSFGEELENIYFDQNEYERIDTRIDTIKSIFKKYGGDLDAVIKYLDEITIKLNNLENSGETLVRLKGEIDKQEHEIVNLQNELTSIRRKSAGELADKIVAVIRTLGMPNARLEIAFSHTTQAYTRHGADCVDFMFSANKGFEPRSLAKIISGGEMSRFMLAYKTVVANLDDIGCMIFDEIDSGISGDIGQKVAVNIHNLSNSKQIIAITHLPSIASFANTHLRVQKTSDDKTTHTIVDNLDEKGTIGEIARMLGSGINDESLAFSRSMRASSLNIDNH